MRLLVSGDRVNVGPQLRKTINRRLGFTLGRFGPAIEQVDVRLGDINGPRGGVDKRCRIVVKLRAAGSRSIAIDGDDETLHAAIARATTRAGKSVARALDRQRGRRTYQRRRAAIISRDVESDR